MEGLGYTQSYASYEETMGIEYELPEIALKIPNSTGLTLLGVGVLLAAVSGTNPALALQVKTNGRCLNARTGPGTHYPAKLCVRNGATLLPVVKRSGSWLQLSSGRWVYGPWTTSGRGSGKATGGTALIRPGSRNAKVRSIQNQLIAKGYSVGPTGADGVYGYKTTHAVRRFQAKNGLLVDGIAGPKTLRALGLSI